MEKDKVSQLIIQVLTEELSVQEAIKAFPNHSEDESLKCAFHALLHYEADEDYREKDPEYADEQIDHLENIAILLKNNESLPVNIIEEYRKYYEDVPVLSQKGWKNIIKSLLRLTI
ncbi:MAG: hypothetical protein A2Y25_00820 [Candidatus Melainabacteria bacterium GWF2_37_15]|nr:MAG: hypothetical protein A2Y25_00820 [Candidatus Melainabacteria bacterium GWF2_37_15]